MFMVYHYGQSQTLPHFLFFPDPPCLAADGCRAGGLLCSLKKDRPHQANGEGDRCELRDFNGGGERIDAESEGYA
jgi:hypothetical protein